MIRPALNKVEPERVAEITGLAVRTISLCADGTKKTAAEKPEAAGGHPAETEVDMKPFGLKKAILRCSDAQWWVG